MVLREHQPVTLILSLQDSFPSSKAKLAPPASFSRPLARRPPFSIGMIAQASPVDQLLAQPEGDEPLDHGGAHLGRTPSLAAGCCWLPPILAPNLRMLLTARLLLRF